MVRVVSVNWPFLNVDAGEMPDEPEELYAVADVVNVACGGHAGDDASMAHVVACCTRFGTRVGAHPSYPDREGFGRRAMEMDDGALEASVGAQCHALAAHARPTHVKLHGALYHAANLDAAIARSALRGAHSALGAVTVIGPASGETASAARELGMPYAREGFADRGVRADGSLVPRGEPSAMIHDPARAAARAREIAGGVDTICVHGDGPNALAIARAVRRALHPAAPLGDRALRVARPRGKEPNALLDVARAWPGVTDAWLTEEWLAVEHEGGALFDDAFDAALDAAPFDAGVSAREHVVDVRYDGADLADVARAIGATPERVVALHAGAVFTVLFLGFLPGFAYLGGLPRELEVARLPAPRPRVAKNAVAIAGRYGGVYPFESPGGWRILGTATNVALFDLERGALLCAGDRVRFREVR